MYKVSRAQFSHIRPLNIRGLRDAKVFPQICQMLGKLHNTILMPVAQSYQILTESINNEISFRKSSVIKFDKQLNFVLA